MKIICIIFSFFISFSSFAASCGQAEATTSPGFCPSFKSVAICHCKKRLPAMVCNNMSINTLYSQMIAIYGSLEKACQWQATNGDPGDRTSKENCIDNWNCYRNGGKNSQGGACSSTGQKCSD